MDLLREIVRNWKPYNFIRDPLYKQLPEIKRYSAYSGKYMDVSGVSMDNGAYIHQWSFLGADNQKWQIQDAGDAYVYLKVKHSGQYLDVEGVSSDNGAKLIQWPFTGAANQQWKLEPANWWDKHEWMASFRLNAAQVMRNLDVPYGRLGGINEAR